MTIALTNSAASPAAPRRSRAWRSRPPLSVALGIGFFAAIVIVSLVGRSWGGSATAQSLREVSRGPSGAHWFGTDGLGRDVFARVLAGTNTAILGPLLIAASGLVISSLLGIAAAYVGGLTDTVIMRWVDFMLALPGLLVAIVVVSVLGGGYVMAIVLLSIFNVQGDIRIVRGAALEQKPLPYIEALRSLGIKRRRIMFRHILPNVAPILVANFAIDFALALVALAGLSFLGLGSEPGTPEWGAMLAENQDILFVNPAASLVPGLVIILLAVSVNLVGDWVYDRYSAPERLARVS